MGNLCKYMKCYTIWDKQQWLTTITTDKVGNYVSYSVTLMVIKGVNEFRVEYRPIPASFTHGPAGELCGTSANARGVCSWGLLSLQLMGLLFQAMWSVRG